MAWIDANTGETASELKTRLDLLGAKVNTGEDIGRSIASAASNNVLRQKQTVVSYEYRGLTENAARLLTQLSTDNTTQTLLYANAKANSMSKAETVSASAMSGTSLKVTASRADESGKWLARFEHTTYEYSGGGWSTVVPQRSSAGVVKSINYRHELRRFMNKGVLLGSKTIKTVTTVKEYPYLTSSSAASKCTPSDTMTEQTQNFTVNGETLSFTYNVGTTVTYDTRFVNDDEGYTVTETTVTSSVVVPQNNSN